MVAFHDSSKIASLVSEFLNLPNNASIPIQLYQRWIWKLIQHPILNRPSLFILHLVFPFAQPPAINLSPSSPSESFMPSFDDRYKLRNPISITPCCQVYLNAPIFVTILSFDWSNKAGAVFYTTASQPTANHLCTIPKNRIASATYTPLSDPQLEAYVRSHNCKTAIKHKWTQQKISSSTYSSHINEIKETTAVMTLDWLSRHGSFSQQVIFLTYPSVTEGALTKGRSSK